MTTDEKIDLRCPVDPRRMFGRVTRGDGMITPDNTIEFVCTDCRKALRAMGEQVSMVLHEFNLLGEHVGTTRRA